MRKRILPIAEVEQFKKDWYQISFPELESKYQTCDSVLRKWAMQYGLQLPKPKGTMTLNLINNKKVDAQQIMERVPSAKLENLQVEQLEELKQCNEEFKKIRNDNSIPKKQKDEMLINLASKSISIFVTAQPVIGSYIESMVSFFKLKMYERRIEISNKEKSEMDEATLKNLKKRFVKEALDDISSFLTVTENRFFDHLLELATNRALESKKQTQMVGDGMTADESHQEPMIDAEIN